MPDHYQKAKNMDQLLDDIRGGSEPGSPAFEQTRTAITVECTKNIEARLLGLQDSINKSSESSGNLAKKVFWLNIVLVMATVVMAYATWEMAFKYKSGSGRTAEMAVKVEALDRKVKDLTDYVEYLNKTSSKSPNDGQTESK